MRHLIIRSRALTVSLVLLALATALSHAQDLASMTGVVADTTGALIPDTSVVLTNDAMFAELICDGIHSMPEMAQLWWHAKGPERAILVTDAMSAAGMPDGEYRLGGLTVQVAQGRATADGVLAGSVLTLDRALVNFLSFTGATVEQGLRLLTGNPAAMTGFEEEAGHVRANRPANLVAVDPEGTLIASFMSGVPVYRQHAA